MEVAVAVEVQSRRKSKKRKRRRRNQRNQNPKHDLGRNYTKSSSLVFSPKAGFGRNQSPVRRPVWLWHTAF